MPPAPATISASAMVATLCLRMPFASSIRIRAGILWVLTCGRSRSAPPARAIIASTLRPIASTKRSSEGLSNSSGWWIG